MGLLKREFKFQQEQDSLYIPLIRQPFMAELNELKTAEFHILGCMDAEIK
jgi:hypothetical protein